MILFEDKDIIVCHKKSGIPVQSARIGQKDMVSILKNYLVEKSIDNKNDSNEVFVVHRLDQPVEGVIVFAKNKKAAAELSRQIADGSMKKIYQSVVCVTEKGKNFLNEKELCYTLKDYLLKNGKTNTSAVVHSNEKDSKIAELSFSLIEKKEKTGNKNKTYYQVEIDLKTGRHHQIRVQMSHAGLPLYGDQKYNPYWQEYLLEEEKEQENELFGYFGAAPVKKNPSLALCSVRLSFLHPSSGKKMIFETKPTTEAFRIFE